MSGLAATIEATALETPGVVGLYRAGSTVVKIISAATDRLAPEEDTVSRVVVTETDEGAEVELAIAVGSSLGAAEIAQAVRDRVRELFAADGRSVFIRLTVVHVTGDR